MLFCLVFVVVVVLFLFFQARHCGAFIQNQMLPAYGLELFSGELSPESYWQGPKSQEVRGGGGGVYLTLHGHQQNESCIKWAAMTAILMFD